MARRLVVFTDSFFDSLNAQVPEHRTAGGVPSLTDLLAYEIPRLMDLLADDYERSTVPVPGETSRFLIGSGRIVYSIALVCDLVDEVVHVFDVRLEFGVTGD